MRRYYVDTSGRDDHAGTSPGMAWRSFRNLGRVQPGDEVLLRRGGVWHGTLVLPGGAPGATVTIASYGDGPRPAIDGTGRDFCVTAERGQSHVVVRGLEIRGARRDGIFLTGGQALAVEDCDLHDNGRAGYNAYATARMPGLVVRHSRFHRNALGGLVASGRVDGMLIEFNEVFENCLSDALEDYTGGIRIISTTDDDRVVDVVTQANHVYRNGRGRTRDRGFGIWYDTVGANCVIRWNQCDENNKAGIHYENGGPRGPGFIYGNVCRGNETGIYVARRTQHCHVRHNTCDGNTYNYWINGDFPSDPVGMSRNELRNNIGQNARQVELRATNGGENNGKQGDGNVYRRNSFGRERRGFIEWGLGNKLDTYDAFDRAYGADSRSLREDPHLAADLSPAPGSPCIGAGDELGLTTGFGFAPFASPPDLGAIPRVGGRQIRLGAGFCGLKYLGGFAQGLQVWDAALDVAELQRLTS